MTTRKIAITAASGTLGRAVANALAERGLAGEVRLAARSVEKLDDLKASGFEIVAADYDDPASLKPAFAGAEVALIISSEGVNEKRSVQHKAAIDAAKAAGVKRIVYTSTANPSYDSRFEWSGAHVDTEAALKVSGVPYTILRDNSYFANNDMLFEQAKATGTLAFPNPDAKVAYVSHEDVAGALAGAITGSGHENRIYEISGANAYTASDLGAALAEVTGREINVVDAPLQAFHDQFRSMRLPDYLVTGLTSFYATLAAGEFAPTSGDVELLSGKPSTSARDYLRKFA